MDAPQKTLEGQRDNMLRRLMAAQAQNERMKFAVQIAETKEQSARSELEAEQGVRQIVLGRIEAVHHLLIDKNYEEGVKALEKVIRYIHDMG